MKFGKLTMEDVDLELVDKDPSNAFDFSLDHYQQQLEPDTRNPCSAWAGGLHA